MSYPLIGGRLRERISGVDRSQAASVCWGDRPRKGDWSDLSHRACGPRKVMKMVPSRMQNRDRLERPDRSHSGEVEAVDLSDPERAWLSE
jgi:hypothetical protein